MATKDSNIHRKGIRTSYFSTVIGISLVLFMIGLVLAGTLGLNQIQRQAKENLQGDLFFKSGWNATDIKQVEQQLKAWDCFADVYFVSPDRAIQEFSGQDENATEVLQIFEGENPLPPTITFRPKAAFASAVGMEKIKERLFKSFPNKLAEVNYDSSSVAQVNLGFKQFVFLFLSVALLLIFVAIAMINNTIRLALYAQRFTIKTMQLVGAKSKFIRRPFLLQALFQGLVAGLIGMGLLMTLFFALNNILDIIEISFDLLSLIALFLAVIGFGMLLTYISTWFALNKYIGMKLDDLY